MIHYFYVHNIYKFVTINRFNCYNIIAHITGYIKEYSPRLTWEGAVLADIVGLHLPVSPLLGDKVKMAPQSNFCSSNPNVRKSNYFSFSVMTVPPKRCPTLVAGQRTSPRVEVASNLRVKQPQQHLKLEAASNRKRKQLQQRRGIRL